MKRTVEYQNEEGDMVKVKEEFPSKKIFRKNIEKAAPCYGCLQGWGLEDKGLWKEVDDLIFKHVFAHGRDFTIQEIYDYVHAHRTSSLSEDDMMVMPFEEEDIRKHLDVHYANTYWRSRRLLDINTEQLETMITDPEGNRISIATFNKEERATYFKLTEAIEKNLAKIEFLKKNKDTEQLKKS